MERYLDQGLSVEERATDLLGRMLPEEKLAQLGCIRFEDLATDGVDLSAQVSRLIPHGIGQVTRIGGSSGLRPVETAMLTNRIQQAVIQGTRLGIPVIVHEEAIGGYSARDATVFPQPLALAATFNEGLVAEVARVIREQLLAVGARLALAPVLDVARDPRWGRVEETFGEDPVLCGALGVAFVSALQGRDLARGVAATGKHFLGHAMSEGARNHGPVHFGPRELREVYAEPFAAAIRGAGLAAVMNSYTSVDGLPCAGSPEILTDLLRGELGFTGVVVADYHAVTLLQQYHHVASSPGEAASLALLAGLDMELPATACFGQPLAEQLALGHLNWDVVDQAVHRVLALKISLHLFERPYVEANRAPLVFDTPPQRELARRAAASGIVLLKNDGVLPLSPAVSRLAVLGPAADDLRLLQGDYHYPAHQEALYEDIAATSLPGENESYLPSGKGAFQPGPYYTPHVTPLQGLKRLLDRHVAIRYAPGCTVSGTDRSGFSEAVTLASESDVAIIFLAGRSGLRPNSTVGEGRDATDLHLTGQQPELVRAVTETGTPTVLVVISGRVHQLTEEAAAANALLWTAPPGEEGGTALAEVISGKVEPRGRLPITFPRRVGMVPLHSGVRAGGSRAMFFGDYSDCPVTPLFPFGHGLSYGNVCLESLTCEAATVVSPIHLSVVVRNSGERPTYTVVQVYVSDLVSSVARPERQLVGWAPVELDTDERALLSFRIDPSRLAFYNPKMRFVIEPGWFRFEVGFSSVDLPLSVDVALNGEVRAVRQRDIVPTTVSITPDYSPTRL